MKHVHVNGNAADVEEGGEAGTAQGTQSALPFKPLSVAFRDVQYSVPLPKVRRGRTPGHAAL